MNAKYASKPNLNPNEADLSRQVVPNPFMGEGPAYFSRRLRRLHIFTFCFFTYLCVLCDPLWRNKNDRTNPILKHKKPCYRVKNAEMKVKKQPKKTKRTHLWITFGWPSFQ
jgi:hypothetical protein